MSQSSDEQIQNLTERLYKLETVVGQDHRLLQQVAIGPLHVHDLYCNDKLDRWVGCHGCDKNWGSVDGAP